MWHVRGVSDCVQGYGTEIHGRPNGRCETILKIILKNLRYFIKKILNWLRDLDFVAEDRDM